MKNLFIFLISLLFLMIGNIQSTQMIVPALNDPVSSAYPIWAHSHWVWLQSHQSNQTNDENLVDSYLNHGIPVGATNIDSQWATADNTFVFNTEKFPDPQGMVEFFHQRGVRIILWATSLLNKDASTYGYANAQGYFLRNVLNETGVVHWWHGDGSFIDFTNPQALHWWQKQMDNVLSIGVDGFKCDGTDPYVFELGEAKGYQGIVSEREYADQYYGTFFNYSRVWNDDALIMSRPVDSFGLPSGRLFWQFSPKYVMFSGWVGDQDPNFEGLQLALQNMFHSAWDGYLAFSSDTGGYRGGGPPPYGRTKTLFIRWMQMSTFTSYIENGGNGQHEPWMYDEQTLEIYRNFVVIHYQLIPYLLETGNKAWQAGNQSIMRPIAKRTIFKPHTFLYMLGEAILVAPMLNNATERTIHFPTAEQTGGVHAWIDWWDRNQVFKAGEKVQSYKVPLDRYPVFIKQATMLALNTSNHLPVLYRQKEERQREDELTVLIMHPGANFEKEILVYHPKPLPTQAISCVIATDNVMRIKVSAATRPYQIHFLVYGVTIQHVEGGQAFHQTNDGATHFQIDSEFGNILEFNLR